MSVNFNNQAAPNFIHTYIMPVLFLGIIGSKNTAGMIGEIQYTIDNQSTKSFTLQHPLIIKVTNSATKSFNNVSLEY